MSVSEKIDVRGFVVAEVAKQLGVKPTEVADFHCIPDPDAIIAKDIEENLGVPVARDPSLKSAVAGKITVAELVEFLQEH